MQLAWHKSKSTVAVVLVLSAVVYFLFGYYLNRTQFEVLISFYAFLFLFFYLLQKNETISPNLLYITGIGFRIIFIVAIPNLSQDFYRFIWDGILVNHGMEVYLHKPDDIVNDPHYYFPQMQELYKGMGSLSASHYTNYPPINQLCFSMAAFFVNKGLLISVIVFKVIIIAADLGIYYFGKKLLQALKLPAKNIFYYFLNPLIIIELTGNLHFEGVMIFFLIWSLYLLHKGMWQWAAVVFALSISIKLIPLMLLPVVWRYLGLKKTVGFYSIVGVVTMALFAPFLSKEFIHKFVETVALWFVNFEFNASIYYLVREVGYNIKGYNTIHIIGKVIPIVMTLTIAILSFLKKNRQFKGMLSTMLLALSIYFFLSTTVHPWYVITLVAVALFTTYQFPYCWSALVMLSYFAYANDGFKESPLLLIIEYTIVIIIFFSEIFKLQVNPFRPKNSI
jgi:alpha-1,6-mannosyltransferase